VKSINSKAIWFTGLSGSGKSTLSSRLRDVLRSRGVPVVVLDGDSLREGLNSDLGFSAADRAENVRRAAEIAKVLCDQRVTVLAAFITPLESMRQVVRGLLNDGTYVEILLDCPLGACESRDYKKLYARARSGDLLEVTGISAPYENPESPDLVLPTGEQTVEQSLEAILNYLNERFPV
jgi:adenylylsulfate kinase